MGPYVAIPKITVDPKSVEGVSDNANIRCLIYFVDEHKILVNLIAKKGFIDIGVNLTISDDSGDLLSTLIAPIQKNEWVTYSFTLKRKFQDRCSFEIYRSTQSYRLKIKGLPIRKK